MLLRLIALTLALLVPLPALAQSRAPLQSPDVLVVGGAPSGVAAALAAARRGLHVVVVTKRPYLGGVLTGAMMDQWDLNVTPSGAPVQAGIFREMYARLGDAFTPESAERAFTEMLAAEPNIEVLPNRSLRGVETEPVSGGRRIVAVELDNGVRVTAPSVVDATDDGEVAARAGARYDLGRQDEGRDTKMQAATLMVALAGVDWEQALANYDIARDGSGGAVDQRIWGYAKLMRTYVPRSPRVVVEDLNFGHERNGRVTMNAIDVLGVDGRDPGSVADARAIAQAESPNLLAFLRAHLPGFAHATIASFAPELYVRETRHVEGLTWLRASDVWNGEVPHDTIGLASYPLDLHPCTRGERPAYAADRHVYGVPLRALIPAGFTNLVLASPAISATHVASGSARVIPTTVEEGEAAGALAALAQRTHRTFLEIATTPSAVSALRADLRENGAVVDRAAVAVR